QRVAVDAAVHHVGVAVVVGEGGPVLAAGTVPAHDPVLLPGQHERAVGEELVLGVAAHDPPAVLDALVGAAADAGHRRTAGAHAAGVDGPGPGDVGEEAGQRGHLRAGCDRPGHGRDVCGGGHAPTL